MPELWFGILLVGVLAGILAGLFGIGGGVVIVPALILLLGFGISEATSTSLAALLLPVSIFAVLTYRRNKLLDLRAALWIAFGLSLTSAFGAWVTLQIDGWNPALMSQLYGLFLLQSGWRMAEPRQLYAAWQNPDRPSPPPPIPRPDDSPVPWPQLWALGLLAGLFAGMFGIGGGVVIVPILTLLLAYEQKRATGTSLAALLLPVGLPGVLVYAREGALDLGIVALVAGGLVLGSIAGSQLAMRLSSKQIRRYYGFFLLAVSIRFIFFPGL